MVKVGIFDYYLDTYGGGEKDICTMAQALSPYYDVEIISFKNAPKNELESKLNVDLSNVKIIKAAPFTSYNLFSRALRFVSVKTAWKNLTRRYDLFVNLVNYVPPPSYAKKNILRVQFPTDKKNLMENNNLLIVNSEYVRNWTKIRWGADAEVLYPPVEHFRRGIKENIFLSVGRFFQGGHNKKHLNMISAFKRMCDNGLKGWEFHLVGGVLAGKKNEEYLREVKKAIKGYPIFIHPDLSFSLLSDFYSKSKIYLHSAGFGEDCELYPERYEHFGITTVEAMSAGCVPVVINGGGQPEIVSHGENGFLWNTEEELIECCWKVIKDEHLFERLSASAEAASTKFGVERYQREVIGMVESILSS